MSPRPKTTTTQLALYLDPAQAVALKTLSRTTGITQQTLLRRGVEYTIARHKALALRMRGGSRLGG